MIDTQSVRMGQSTIQSPQKHHNHPAVCSTLLSSSSNTNAAAAVACHCKDYTEPAKVSKMRVFKKIKKKFGLTKCKCVLYTYIPRKHKACDACENPA